MFTLSGFLAKFAIPSLIVVRNKRRMMKKIRCRRSKYIFMNRFYFAAWDIGFAFGAARLVERLCFLRRN